MKNWDRLSDEYLELYRARGVCEESALKVRRELDGLGCWLKNRRPRPRLEEVGSDLLVEYVRGRTSWHAKSTLSGVISVLRGWGDFLVTSGVWRGSPLRWMRGPRLGTYHRMPRRIGPEAQKGLWEQALGSRQEYHRYLWLAVLSLLYGTGLRRGELERLDVSDWSASDGTLTVDGRKTGRERRLAVPAVTWRCIEGYLPRRHNQLELSGEAGEPALLVGRDGRRLSSQAISQAVKRLAERAGVEHVTLHQFRHSCASDLLESGVRLPEVQLALGHRSLSTTMRYLHVADPQRHMAAALHPINGILGAAAGEPRASVAEAPNANVGGRA